ncbi:MAG: DUF4384 domain-containing protein [Longimicrobiales bacterium]
MRPVILFVLLAIVGPANRLLAQEATRGLEARVWLDRGGEEPVLRRGESVRIYYRTSEDAFAAIFRIDTDGRVSLLYPQHPGAIDLVRGGRDYRLLTPDAAGWRVEEDPGMAYLFVVASPEPLDFSLFPFDEQYGWDLGAVGGAIYTDPYVAIDDYVAAIVPGWETVPYALDFLTYSVGETYSYPRFLCYDCHTYQRYSSWNPYDYNCQTYRVVIYDDPFFYPRYRYSGVNVVYAWPARALPRYEVSRRVVGDAVAPIVRVRTPAQREAAYAEYKESPLATPSRTAGAARRVSGAPTGVAAPSAGSAGVGLRSATTPALRRSAAESVASPQERPRTGVMPQQVPDTARARPTLQRRPSAGLPVRTPPSTRPTQPGSTEPKSVTPAPSRTTPRAPIGRSQPEPRAPPNAPTTRPTPSREPAAAPTPSRPSARSAPERPTGQQPSTGVRPQSTPRTTPSTGSTTRPAASRPATSRPATSRPATSRPAAAPPRENPPARSSAPSGSAEPRSTEPRPTVRSRPAEPAPRN